MATPPPLPTLALAEAPNLILNLLQNNAGCRLPCWWGFTPGITRWEDARRFLETFAKIIDYPGLPTDVIYNPEVVVPVSEDIHPLQSIHTTYYTLDEGGDKLIQRISVSTGNVPAYRLPAILSEYGQPDEIWMITSAGSGSSRDVPFTVVLSYASQGFVVDYSVNVLLRMPIIGCPQYDKNPWLILWSPQEGKTYADIAHETRDFGYGNPLAPTPIVSSFLPLEQATGMSVETFYNTFKDENNMTCLETPLELWLAGGQTVISTVVGPAVTMTPTP